MPRIKKRHPSWMDKTTIKRRRERDRIYGKLTGGKLGSRSTPRGKKKGY